MTGGPRSPANSRTTIEKPRSCERGRTEFTSMLAVLLVGLRLTFIAAGLLSCTGSLSFSTGLAGRKVPRTLHIRTRSGRHIGFPVAIDVSSGHSHRRLTQAGLAGRFASCLILRGHRYRLMHPLPGSLSRSHIAWTSHLLRTRGRVRSCRFLLTTIRLRNCHCRQTRQPHKQNLPVHFGFLSVFYVNSAADRLPAESRQRGVIPQDSMIFEPHQTTSQVTNVQHGRPLRAPHPCRDLCDRVGILTSYAQQESPDIDFVILRTLGAE